MRRLHRIPAWLALALCGSSLIVTGHVMEARAAEVAVPVTVTATGDSDNFAELRGWQNVVFGASIPVDFSYYELGSTVARRDLLDGTSEFAIVGVPFTEAELAERPADAGELIELPVSVTSLSVIVTEPTSGGQPGWLTARVDPECDDPNGECETLYSPYTGPIRIPPDNLSAIVMNLPASFRNNNFAEWSHPAMRATADGSLTIQQRANQRHSALSRTEGTAANKFIMDYFAELAPTAWSLSQANYAEFPYEPVREEFSTRQKTRSRLDAQLRDIMRTESAGEGGRPPDWTGNLGVIPTTYLQRLAPQFPLVKYRVVEIQNANGDWVSATPETVGAAVAAGDRANIATYEKVPGAYPLVYTNRLYTVAGTLTPSEANALAAIVRYVATDGQQAVVDHLGTALTAPMVAEALAGADAIVEKNCSQAGFEVVVAGPSEFEADTTGVQAIASMKHCVPTPPPPPTTTTTTIPETTTTAPATTTTTSDTSTTQPTLTTTEPTPTATATQPPRPATTNPPSAAPAATTPPAVAEVTATVADTVAEEAATTVPPTTVPAQPSTTSSTLAPRARGVALAELPMKRPSDGSSGPKQLGTLMLGSALFLGPRKYLNARRTRT